MCPPCCGRAGFGRGKEHPKNQQRRKQPLSRVKSSWGATENQITAPGPPVTDSGAAAICGRVHAGSRSKRTNSPAPSKSRVQGPRGRHTGWPGGPAMDGTLGRARTAPGETPAAPQLPPAGCWEAAAASAPQLSSGQTEGRAAREIGVRRPSLRL